MTKPWKPLDMTYQHGVYNVRSKVLTSALLSFKSSRMWCAYSHRYVVSDVTKDNSVFIYRVKQSKMKKIYTVWPRRSTHSQLLKYGEWHTRHSVMTHKTWIFKTTIWWHSGELKFYFSVKFWCIWSTIHSFLLPTTQLRQLKFNNVYQLSSS